MEPRGQDNPVETPGDGGQTDQQSAQGLERLVGCVNGRGPAGSQLDAKGALQCHRDHHGEQEKDHHPGVGVPDAPAAQ